MDVLLVLTKKEFQILELLMSYPGKVYSAEEKLHESIWGRKQPLIQKQSWFM